MSNYLVTAQAEVLYEKAYNILAKYARLTSNNEKEYPRCIDDMEVNIVKLAKNIILAENQEEIEQAKISLTVYDNIINNISELSKSGARLWFHLNASG